MGAAALAYAKRGIPVFPCEPGGKRPLTRSGFWEATDDERVVRAWWRRWPRANVGVPTGKRSGLLVLDVDPDDGGAEALAELERTKGVLPDTTRARTGGGGVHVYFRYPGSAGDGEREEVRNSASWVGPGLDVRGEGGYVLVPPSRTEAFYGWSGSSPLAPAPDWLLALMRGRRPGWGEETLF